MKHWHYKYTDDPEILNLIPDDPKYGKCTWLVKRWLCDCGWDRDHEVDPIPRRITLDKVRGKDESN